MPKIASKSAPTTRSKASKTSFETVDDYIASQPAASRTVLERVRKTIRKAVPGAKESVAYNIAAFKLDGTAVLYFAGWKEHYSLYPATPHVVAALAKDLASYEVQEGTIRFPLANAVPTKLIEEIAKLRAEEAAARGAKKKRAAQKPASKKASAKVTTKKAGAKKLSAKVTTKKATAKKPAAKKPAAKKPTRAKR